MRPRLGSASALIFDMRGYPSFNTPARLPRLPRLSDSLIQSAKFEVPQITRPDGAVDAYTDGAWKLAPVQPRTRAKVVFLTDGRAISYAESTMGIVEHYKLGEIVGEPTAGTNGNINPFTLPGGYTVSWTGMRERKQDGSAHHGVGIQPSVPGEAHDERGARRT